MADNYSEVDIAPSEALHTIRNLLISLKNMGILNNTMIEKYGLLQSALNDDGYDYILKELNKAKSLIEQSILESHSIVDITEDYVEYVRQSYEKLNY